MVWEKLKVNENYEINTEYPYKIRRVGSEKPIKESIHNTGYIRCHLDLKDYRKHRLIAIQWLDNPNNFDYIDHCDRNKLNNHISNLRWIDNSGNQKNNSSYKGIEAQYVNELPLKYKSILKYGEHEFKDYFIDEDNIIYQWNGVQYRIIKQHTERNFQYYNLRDVNKKQVKAYLTKLLSYL